MSGRSDISATDLASCVFPVPARPSMSSGLPSLAARLTTPAILSSARYPAAARPARTDAVSANTPATSSAWVTWGPPELSAADPHYCAVTSGALSSRRRLRPGSESALSARSQRPVRDDAFDSSERPWGSGRGIEDGRDRHPPFGGPS